MVAAAHAALDGYGFGMASVRFISGTHVEHRALESEITEWLGTDDTILFPSCFDANGGVFETLLDAEDAVVSDELNHASIIDGVRLSKAQRYRYKNRDMADLDAQLTARARRAPAASWSSPTACSRWTATSPRSTSCARWPRSTARW